MIVLGDVLKGAEAVATKLRAEGVKVAVDITGRKLDKQIKSAVKMKVPYLLFVGEKELADDSYRLKDIKTEEEKSLSIERIVTTVEDYRRKNDDEL
jgi:histidyl-tRNA synthetase